MLRLSPAKHPTKCDFLSLPLFLRDRLLVEVHGRPAIRMPEKFLGNLDVHSFLMKPRSQAMAEQMPSNLFRDSDPFQCRPNVASQNHVRSDRLRPVLCNRREEVSCRESGITGQTNYRWRKEYGGWQVDQARR